jgi:hypothetical protein
MSQPRQQRLRRYTPDGTVKWHFPVAPVEPSLPAGQFTGRVLWLRWVLGHVLILGAVWAVTIWLADTTYYSVGALFALPFAIVAPFVAQWLGVRRVLGSQRQFGLWIVATLLSGGLSALLMLAPFAFGIRDIPSFLILGIIGMSLGLMQWLVLQRHVSRAYWWIPANAVGWVAGAAVGPLVFDAVGLLCQSSAKFGSSISSLNVGVCDYLGQVLAFVAVVAVFSIITGTTLVWLVGQKGEVRPVLSGRQVALGIGMLVLAGLLFAGFGFFQAQARVQAIRTLLWDVSMVSADEGWAVGDESGNTALWHYVAGKWTETKVTGSQAVDKLHGVSMDSVIDGWSVGENSTFMHYVDGTWENTGTPEGIGTGLYVGSIDMISPSEGWAIATDYRSSTSSLLHYTNGKWTSTQSPTSGTLSAVNIVSSEDGWAVGDNGTILHYSGGKWRQVASPTTLSLSGVDMVSKDDGWAIGENGTESVILHYEGGKWNKVASPAHCFLQGISMVSAREGWAVGTSEWDYDASMYPGVIVHYKDGKWVKEDLAGMGKLATLHSVSMAATGEGWAVGNEATMLHYDGGRWTRYK